MSASFFDGGARQRSRVKFLIGHSCGTLLWHPLVGHSWGKTSCKSPTSSTQNERFARDFLRNSDIKSPKQAFRTRLTPKVTRRVSKTSVSQNGCFARDFLQTSRVKSSKRAFRARLPPKLTCQVPKTSVSYETSSKTHQSLPNERFARDFLQKSSGNTHRSTHITQPCQAVSRFQPLQTTPAHTPIPM